VERVANLGCGFVTTEEISLGWRKILRSNNVEEKSLAKI
jgi:hypothetical protein